MTPGESASVAAIRRAVRARVSESTLRQAASEIGIAHQTLHSFLSGKGKPHARTHALLLDWYGRDENEVLRLREQVAELKRELAECRKMRGK